MMSKVVVDIFEWKSKRGGEGSGNFGHEGRPGEIGGSGSGGSGVSKIMEINSGLKDIPVIETPAFGQEILGRYDENKNIVYLGKEESQKPLKMYQDEEDGTPPFNRFTGKDATLTHEYAHALDYDVGKQTSSFGLYGRAMSETSDEWKNMFDYQLNNYKLNGRDGSVISRYSMTNVREFFAESVTSYMLDPEWLQSRNPAVYNLVDLTLNSLKE